MPISKSKSALWWLYDISSSLSNEELSYLPLDTKEWDDNEEVWLDDIVLVDCLTGLAETRVASYNIHERDERRYVVRWLICYYSLLSQCCFSLVC